MRKLILFFTASIILSSCSSTTSKENGRYSIKPGDALFILDTQTGRIYYRSDEGFIYVDVVTTAKKKIDDE